MPYLEVLDDLTDKECRVFLYCKILKITPTRASERLKLQRQDIQKIIKNIEHDFKINQLCYLISQVYDLPDM